MRKIRLQIESGRIHLQCSSCSVTSVVFNSVRSHRWQPTRLPHPWDSPGKNTGMGYHFLSQCIKVKGESEVAQSCPILCDPMDYSLPCSSIHGIFQARVLEWVAIAFSDMVLQKVLNEKNSQNRLQIKIPYDPAIPLLGIYPTEVCTYFQEKTCTRLFRVAKNEITQTSINKRMAK